MDFDEMKIIWDSQNEQPLYVMDEAALHSSIRRKGVCIEKYITFFEYVMIGCLPIVAMIIASKRVLSGVATEPWQNTAILLMLAVGFLGALPGLWARWRRRKREQAFQPTLLGDIDKAISKLDYQATRVASWHWHFLLPLVVIGILSSVSKGRTSAEFFESPRVWMWPLLLLAFVLCFVASRIAGRQSVCSRHDSLRSLREKLVREEPSG